MMDRRLSTWFRRWFLLLLLLQLLLLLKLVVQVDELNNKQPDQLSNEIIDDYYDHYYDDDDYSDQQSEPLPRPLITFEMDGRLGNLMLQYATLFLIGQQLNLSVRVLEEMHKELAPHFSPLPLSTVSRGPPQCLCPGDYEYFRRPKESSCPNVSCLCDECQRWQARLLSWVFIKRWESEERRRQLMELDSILLWAFHSDLVVSNLKVLSSLFVFNSDIRHRAEKFIDEKVCSNRQLHDNNRSCSNMTLVSVHVRRGDYEHYLEEVFNGHLPDVSFHEKAMEWFRERFDNVVFVVASDDLDFCFRHWGNRSDVVLVQPDAHFELSVVDELAILTLCTHSIYDVGSFGFWSAALKSSASVNAHVYVADKYSRVTHPLLAAVKRVTPAHWKVVDVSDEQ